MQVLQHSRGFVGRGSSLGSRQRGAQDLCTLREVPQEAKPEDEAAIAAAPAGFSPLRLPKEVQHVSPSVRRFACAQSQTTHQTRIRHPLFMDGVSLPQENLT